MKIAIIGAGIAGLGAGYLLHPQHDITVYEANSYAGGHSRTILIPDNNRRVPVDTGFIVFNKKNYPLLTRLFEKLGVPIAKSNMSFGVSIKDGWLEYSSKGMFAQKANLIRPLYLRMIMDILRFNRRALRYVARHPDMTLGQCLKAMKMEEWFSRYYIQAMGAAIWSCSTETILEFPASTFLQFFDNHGLLTVDDQPQWYTVAGGSREYIGRLTESFKDRIRLSCPVASVQRFAEGIEILDGAGARSVYDYAIFACHADQALKMLKTPSQAERDILSAFQYQDNHIIVHSDTSFMPKIKACWASWVYRSDEDIDRRPVVSLSYWMNQLQNLDTEKPVFITLNPGREPHPSRIYDEHVFRHPVFNLQTLRAQQRMYEIQNKDRISYCGAYHRYGFHEDGFMSAVAVAKALGADFND